MREKKEAVVVRPMAFVFVVFSYLLSKNSDSISLILHFLQIDWLHTRGEVWLVLLTWEIIEKIYIGLCPQFLAQSS